MPTSDAPRADEQRVTTPKSTIIRRILTVSLILAVLLALDVALCLALQPYGSAADITWYEYRQCADEQVETLVIGTSTSQDGLNPQPLNERLSTNTVNLSSTCQSTESSLVILRRALSDHPEIKRVLLGTSYSELESRERVDTTTLLTQAMATGQGPVKAAITYSRLFTDSAIGTRVQSMAALVPFTLSHVSYTPSAIKSNVLTRLECESPIEAMEQRDSHWVNLGHGFAVHDVNADFATIPFSDVYGHFVAGEDLDAHELASLKKLCAFCSSHDLELIVFVLPSPFFQQISLGELYPQNMSQVRDLVETNGATYLDFNLIHPDLFSTVETDFCDALHLNADGALKFSAFLGDTIVDLESGQDLKPRFYSYEQWDEYLRTTDQIWYAFFEDEIVGNELQLTGIAFAGPSCQVEYEYALLDEASGEWQVFRDWSVDPVCMLPETGYGNVQVRLSVRQTGASEPERVRYRTVTCVGT